MGIFSGIQNTFKKSEAAVVIQNLFEIQQKVGIFPYNSAKIANQLVGDLWDQKPDIFSGKFGVRPHKLAIAAAALGHGLYLFQNDSSLRSACLVALGEILKTVDLNGAFFSFNNIDRTLFNAATEMFAESAEMNEAERGNLSLTNNQVTNVAELAGNFLLPVMTMCRSVVNFEEKLNSKFTRGYLIGFFDGAAQYAKLQFKGDEEFFLFATRAHTELLGNDISDPSKYALASLKLQGDPDFDRGQTAGGQEYFAVINEKKTYPTVFMKCFHEM